MYKSSVYVDCTLDVPCVLSAAVLDHLTLNQGNYQGCGSATRIRDSRTKTKKIKLALTWSRVGPSLQPVYNPAKQKFCASPITRNVGPTLMIRIWILAFCLCNPLFFCFIAWNGSSHWHWWLLCAAACQATLDIDCQVTTWNFCYFSPYSLFSRQRNLWETNVCASRIVQYPKSVDWHSSTTKFRDSQGGIKLLMMNILAAVHFA